MRASPAFRLAPTPSRELHVGNALAALFGWAMARAARGRFVLRIEDIDRARCKPAYEEAIYRELGWLGLDWDEGPDVGGPHGPYRQSERLDRYDALLVALHSAGLTYVCVCSRADIRAAQSAPHTAWQSGLPVPGFISAPVADELPYPGTCRGRGFTLPADRGGVRLDLGALAERLRLDPLVEWCDGLRGPRREDVRVTSGDVLLGRPGQPTYQLAVVADDRAMGITDVVRGVDLIGSTARQLLLHRALPRLRGGDGEPRFFHHPLLLDGDGRKLSKRDAALSLTSIAANMNAADLRATLGRAVGLFSAAVTHATCADWVEAVAEHGLPDRLHDARWPPVATPR